MKLFEFISKYILGLFGILGISVVAVSEGLELISARWVIGCTTQENTEKLLNKQIFV